MTVGEIDVLGGMSDFFFEQMQREDDVCDLLE